MGLKNVFDRLKGKPQASKNSGANRDELSRRQTGEETIQVNAAASRAEAPPAAAGQESATVVAPAPNRPMPKAPPQPSPSAPAVNMPAPDSGRHDEQATVAASSSPPPAPAVATPSARPAVSAAPRRSPSVTPVAPNPNRQPTPAPAPAAAPSVRPNTSAPSVSSGDETLYQKPSEDESLEIAGVLVGIFGAVKNQLFAVPQGSATIGRADNCAVQFLDAKVSREHATIRCEDGVLEITPLNDRNPLLVNDEPIEGPHPLSDGDKLQFGNAGASVLRFRTVDGL